jgi:hypothetical protein
MEPDNMNKLFEQTSINVIKLANRFVRSATREGMATDDGACAARDDAGKKENFYRRPGCHEWGAGSLSDEKVLKLSILLIQKGLILIRPCPY